MKRRNIILLLLIVVLAGAAYEGWSVIRRGFSARDNPSALEAYVARAVRRLSVPAAVKQTKNPFTPTPEVLAEARAHFADHCATCHGNDGSGQTTIGRNLYPKPPDMRLPQTQNLTDGEIYYIIHHGIRLTGMPAWGDPLADNDSWKLVYFIRHLPKLTPEEKKEMGRFNPRSQMERSEEEKENQFLNGEKSSGKPMQEHHH